MFFTSGPKNKCRWSHTNSKDSRVRHVAFTSCRNQWGGGDIQCHENRSLNKVM